MLLPLAHTVTRGLAVGLVLLPCKTCGISLGPCRFVQRVAAMPFVTKAMFYPEFAHCRASSCAELGAAELPPERSKYTLQAFNLAVIANCLSTLLHVYMRRVTAPPLAWAVCNTNLGWSKQAGVGNKQSWEWRNQIQARKCRRALGGLGMPWAT